MRLRCANRISTFLRCEQAPALDAGRHCNALNHNAGSLQKVINIARQFTLCGLIRFPETDARERQKRVHISAIRRVRCRATTSSDALLREPEARAENRVQY